MPHSPFFRIAFVFLLAAIIVYVMTNNLALGPGKKAGVPVPAPVPALALVP